MPEQPSRADLLAQVAAEAPGHGASAVRLNIAIAHQLAMPLADVQCMGLLADGPSAPGDLAARLGLTSGAMTKVLDRLERAGYIHRAADPSDRRRVTIAADPDGLARLAAHYAPMGEKMSRYLDELSTADLAAVLAFMRAGREAADEEIARIRRQGIRHATRRPGHRGQPGQPAG